MFLFFFSSRRRHTRWPRDWSSDVCSSDLVSPTGRGPGVTTGASTRPVGSWPFADHPRLTGDRVAEIGRASCRKECRTRRSAKQKKKKQDTRAKARKTV